MTQPLITNARCRELLAEVLCPNHVRGFQKHGKNKGGMSGGRLRRVIKYVDENLDQRIELRKLASVVSLSAHHFRDVFKTETGKSPHNFLIHRRVCRAQELLLESDLSIAQIAVDVGFSGQSHLTRHFRMQTGMTPFRFRLAQK